MYQSCYDLIHQYIFNNVELTSNQDLVCILVATIACLFLIALPFCIVWRLVCKWF